MRFKKIILSAVALSLLSTSLSSCGLNFDNIINKADEVLNTIKERGAGAWNDTLEWGTNTRNNVSTWGETTWSQVVNWSSNTGEAAAERGETVINGTKNFFCNVGDYIIGVANGVATFGLKKGVNSLDLSKGLETGNKGDWNEYLNDYEAITYALISTQLQKSL